MHNPRLATTYLHVGMRFIASAPLGTPRVVFNATDRSRIRNRIPGIAAALIKKRAASRQGPAARHQPKLRRPVPGSPSSASDINRDGFRSLRGGHPE
jgi:hypothetical protein